MWVPPYSEIARIFNTDAEEFGGSGLGDTAPLKTVNTPATTRSRLVHRPAPMSAVIYRCTRRSPVRKKKDAGKEGRGEEAVPQVQKSGGGRKVRAAKTAARKSKAAARPRPKAKSET